MELAPMPKLKMPAGVPIDGKMKIAVTLDKAIFDDVCQYALNRGWTFSAAINDLVKCGILDIKDAEEFEQA